MIGAKQLWQLYGNRTLGRVRLTSATAEFRSSAMPTLGIWPDSVGNARVTCRSADIRFEGRLTDPANANYRPKAVLATFSGYDRFAA